MLTIKDVQRILRAPTFTRPEEAVAFAQQLGPIPAPELVKLLSVFTDGQLPPNPQVHKLRCLAFQTMAEASLDPELFAPYLRALRVTDPELRAVLVRVLPKVNRVALHGELCQLLGAPEPGLRAAAAEVLRQVGGKSAFDSLNAMVRQPSFAGRTEAMDVLVPKVGHHALPLLEGVLAAGTATEKANALRYLADRRVVGRDLDGARKLVSRVARDPDERVAASGIMALASLVESEEEFFDHLGDLVESTRVPVVKAIIASLARFSSTRVPELLEARFRAGPNAMRIAILETAQNIGTEDVLPVVVAALSHKQIQIRNKAADVLSVLGQSGRVDPARTIIWLLRSRDVNVRRLAVDIAAKVGDKGGELVPRLLRYLRDEDWWVRERVLDALVELAGKNLTQHLVEYLSDPSDVVRRYAVGGLVRLKDPRALGALVRTAMSDEDWWCREQAVEATAEIGDARAIPYIVDILGKQPAMRVACLAALGRLKADQAAPTVAALLSDDDVDVRLAVIRFFSEINDPRAAPLLANCESDPSAEVRLAARELALRWKLAAGITAAGDDFLTPLDRWLVACVDAQGDDLYLAADRVPYAKRLGSMTPLSNRPITNEEIAATLFPHLAPAQREALAEGREVDFSYEVKIRNLRFRANIFRQMTGLAAVFRTVKNEILSIDKLHLPPAVARFAELKHGLVLIGGPTGSGKSTTLAGLIDHINRTSDRHIVTIEDPIEVVHTRNRCLINQREVGTHTRSFNAALRATMRQDPDVILVGEMRDLATIQFAVTAAETGHLVFGTVHTVSADTSVERLINAFPPRQQAQVRSILCESLRAVVCQHLIKRKDGNGRVLAVEVMINNEAIENMIRKGKTFQIPSVIATSREQGMQSMDSELARLVLENLVEYDEAYMKANDKKAFEGLVGADPQKAKAAGATTQPSAVAR